MKTWSVFHGSLHCVVMGDDSSSGVSVPIVDAAIRHIVAQSRSGEVIEIRYLSENRSWAGCRIVRYRVYRHWLYRFFGYPYDLTEIPRHPLKPIPFP